MSQADSPDKRIDTDAFVAWCEEQVKQSRSRTSRIIVNDDEMVKYRLREGDSVEDIILLKGENTDTLRFDRDGEKRQFHAHRRDVTFHDKTLIVRHSSGEEMARAGTGTRNKKGPFPI